MKCVVSIYDSCAETWYDPIFAINAGAAVRSFQDHVNSNGNDINAHPEHFILFKLAEFDPSDGMIHPLRVPEVLVRALDIIQNPMLENGKNASS